jgi:hypothetical protein
MTRQFFYIIAIVIIWTCVLYFFVHVYVHNQTLPVEHSKIAPKSAVPPSLVPRLNLTIEQKPFEPLMTFQKGHSDSIAQDEQPPHADPNPSPILPATRTKSKKTENDYKAPNEVPWTTFAEMDMYRLQRGSKFSKDPNTIVCPQEVEDKLTQRLPEKDFQWCQWALNDTHGGKVKVGKSYGTLKGPQREKYEKLNCNTVSKGQNPSCDDAWGDNAIVAWKKNILQADLCGNKAENKKNKKEKKYSSKVICRDSLNNQRVCVFENVLMDFSKLKNVRRPGRSDSRAWDKGFLTTDCDPVNSLDIDYYKYFYQPGIQTKAVSCDYVINETVLVYGHDDTKNLGHSMSDFMNVWAMLWLSGLGNYAQEMVFLNMDAIRMGHNYYDDLGRFSR